jgi:DNA-binding MarR family transcriptional regulator
VSVVVKRLVERKLVTRKPSEEDGRRVELSVTSAGRRLLARCPEPTQARLVASLRRLSPDELASLKTGIKALEREMGTQGAARMFFDEEAPSGRSARASRAAVRP